MVNNIHILDPAGINQHMPKQRIVFLPAAIHSHVIPSLYLADLLASEYDIYYAVVNSDLADLVTRNGYKSILISGWQVGYTMEHGYLLSLNEKPGFFRLLHAYHNDELYYYRKSELDTLVESLQPVAILIDLFICTDFWILNRHRKRVRLMFFNPMLSTYRCGGDSWQYG